MSFDFLRKFPFLFCFSFIAIIFIHFEFSQLNQRPFLPSHTHQTIQLENPTGQPLLLTPYSSNQRNFALEFDNSKQVSCCLLIVIFIQESLISYIHNCYQDLIIFYLILNPSISLLFSCLFLLTQSLTFLYGSLLHVLV